MAEYSGKIVERGIQINQGTFLWVIINSQNGELMSVLEHFPKLF